MDACSVELVRLIQDIIIALERCLHRKVAIGSGSPILRQHPSRISREAVRAAAILHRLSSAFEDVSDPLIH